MSECIANPVWWPLQVQGNGNTWAIYTILFRGEDQRIDSRTLEYKLRQYQCRVYTDCLRKMEHTCWVCWYTVSTRRSNGFRWWIRRGRRSSFRSVSLWFRCSSVCWFWLCISDVRWMFWCWMVSPFTASTTPTPMFEHSIDVLWVRFSFLWWN